MFSREPKVDASYEYPTDDGLLGERENGCIGLWFLKANKSPTFNTIQITSIYLSSLDFENGRTMDLSLTHTVLLTSMFTRLVTFASIEQGHFFIRRSRGEADLHEAPELVFLQKLVMVGSIDSSCELGATYLTLHLFQEGQQQKVEKQPERVAVQLFRTMDFNACRWQPRSDLLPLETGIVTDWTGSFFARTIIFPAASMRGLWAVWIVPLIVPVRQGSVDCPIHRA